MSTFSASHLKFLIKSIFVLQNFFEYRIKRHFSLPLFGTNAEINNIYISQNFLYFEKLELCFVITTFSLCMFSSTINYLKLAQL